jgi:thymidylate synthase (FAD)
MTNKIQLIGHYGSDEVIACSAWTSTSRDITEDKREHIPKLINMLWSNGHETPFEKGVVHFLIDCDIASHVHLLKHRISSLNAESARYKELKEDKFYIPNDWKEIKVTNSVTSECYEEFVFAANDEDWQDVLERYTKLGNDLYHQCIRDIEPVLGRKRAKESARYFKTYNSQIQSDLMFNMRSFANFLKLRKSEHAQKEIHDIASTMLDLVKNIEGNPFKYTLDAFGY